MNNIDKFTINSAPQQIKIAGFFPHDSNIEFVGIHPTKEVLWLQNGNNHYFRDLPIEVYNIIKKLYKKDKTAQSILKNLSQKLMRQLELYTFYMFGAIDSTPDYENGKLSNSENFRDDENCISKDFDYKKFRIGQNELNHRDLIMIDMMKKEYPDKAIAAELQISMSTYDYHKRNLFKKAGCTTKVGLILTSNINGI